MKNNQYQNIEDFVTDLDFIRWVKNPAVEDQIFWQDWLQQYPEKKEQVEEARKIVAFVLDQSSVNSYNLEDYQEVKANILNQLNDKKTFALPQIWKIAAGFILLCSLAFFWWNLDQRTEYVVYQTSYGETRQIVLPDQSVVVLNANSSLKTRSNWQSVAKRELWLNGEAFFKVQEISDQSFPAEFLVHTDNDVDIEVLGTEFNVNHRHQKSEVVLASGKVKISSAIESLLMNPGEAITYSNQSKKFQKSSVHSDQYKSWTSNQLVFEDTPIDDIQQKMNDLFGLQLVFNDLNSEDKKFTGSAPYENLEILYVSIARTFDLNYQKKENQIVFNKDD